MVKCKECGNEIKLNWNLCPHCGSEIRRLSPEEAKAAIKIIEGIQKRMRSELDMSPEGIRVTKNYIDVISNMLLLYSKNLKIFMDHHEQFKAKPTLFNDEEWKMNTTIGLAGLFAIATGVIDGKADSEKRIPEVPLGCQRVGFEVGKIQQFTEELGKAYSAFDEGRDRNSFEKASKAIEDINDRLQRALDELDSIIAQVGEGLHDI